MIVDPKGTAHRVEKTGFSEVEPSYEQTIRDIAANPRIPANDNRERTR